MQNSNHFYILMISFAVIQAVLFLTHWFLYKTSIYFFKPASRTVVMAARVITIFLSLSFILTSLFVFNFDHFIVRVFYTAAAVWLGFFYFFLWAAVLTWLIYGGQKFFNITFNIKAAAGILFCLAVVVGVYAIINAANVRVVNLVVKLPNLSSEWQGKTAVFISDLHLGPVRNYGFVTTVAEKIATLKPDIVFIGGDFYDGTAADLKKLVEPFKEVNAPLGKYFVAGNHEEFSDKSPFLEALNAAGFKILNNEKTEIAGVQIIGVDYFDTRKEEGMRSVLKTIGVDENKPTVLLAHSSYHFKISEEEGIDFQLSGHSHAGQIFPANVLTHFIFRGFDYGLRKSGGLTVYTSSGAGTWAIPMRWWTRPEIVLITFQ